MLRWLCSTPLSPSRTSRKNHPRMSRSSDNGAGGSAASGSIPSARQRPRVPPLPTPAQGCHQPLPPHKVASISLRPPIARGSPRNGLPRTCDNGPHPFPANTRQGRQGRRMGCVSVQQGSRHSWHKRVLPGPGLPTAAMKPPQLAAPLRPRAHDTRSSASTCTQHASRPVPAARPRAGYRELRAHVHACQGPHAHHMPQGGLHPACRWGGTRTIPRTGLPSHPPSLPPIPACSSSRSGGWNHWASSRPTTPALADSFSQSAHRTHLNIFFIQETNVSII